MAKLGRSAMPPGHARDDFECFGPVATKDTVFSGCKLADLGCFKQDEGVDSNKYYSAAVVKSKKDGNWYMYVEYGRTNDGVPDRPQYQFTACASEAEACAAFEKQCAGKNTKRGKWEKVGSKDRYVPKVRGDGTTEDLYVVRYMASRCVGLPAAKNICNSDAVAAVAPTKKATKADKTHSIDLPTRKLFQDLLGGAVKYTRSTMVGGTLPALTAIVEAKELLQDALACLAIVGNDVKKQVADPTLKRLTYTLYGMIPKVKPQGVAESQWILSQENVLGWQDDLDAFETALKSANVEDAEGDDVMHGIPADVSWIDPSSDLGKWLIDWWGSGKARGHGDRSLTIHNLWRVSRHGDDDLFNKNVDDTVAEMPKSWNNERPTNNEKQKMRPDLAPERRKAFWKTNTGLLFHGSRSVNVPGIVRESFRFPAELAKTGVVINGAMFGPGIYNADIWSKSSNYCSHPGAFYAGGGGVAGRQAFMFACDMILGHPHVAPDAYGFTSPPPGHHSVFGKAGHTRSWGGTLANNEWITYKKGRVVIRYLAEISW